MYVWPTASLFVLGLNALQITALLDLQDMQRRNALAQAHDQKILNSRLNALEANQNQLAALLSESPSQLGHFTIAHLLD